MPTTGWRSPAEAGAGTLLPTSEGAAANSRSRDLLPHLDGARALAALWIVCHHVQPREDGSFFTPFVTRVDIAVEYFMLLSGFLTHYIYGPCTFSTPRSFAGHARFWVRRLARPLITAQGATLVSVFLRLCGHFELSGWRVFSCLFFVKGWMEPAPDCPNMPTWYIDALLPSWIIYPVLTQPALTGAAELPPLPFALLGSLLWFAALGPSLSLLALNGSWLTWRQVTLTWFWPPAQLADFALGAYVAAAARKWPARRCFGIVADIALAIVLLTAFCVPLPETPKNWDGPAHWRPGHYMCWEQLTGRFAAPLLALYLYGTSGEGSCSSLSVMAFSHRALVSMGSYTLEVYLFQAPLRDAVFWVAKPFAAAPWLWSGLAWGPEVFFGYLLFLWLISGLFAEFCGQPLQRLVHAMTADWVGSDARGGDTLQRMPFDAKDLPEEQDEAQE